MAEGNPALSRMMGRRGALGFIAGIVALPAMAAGHPSLAYMQKFAQDMLNAHRQGTVDSFRRVIVRHADLTAIADYSLGQYAKKLPASQRERYYGGVATFMARYFADQSREFRVAKYEIGEATADDKDVLIDSRVFLLSGEKYTVVWRLVWRGKGYKVADAKVLGFSMVYMQRGLFTSYISKRNGDVAQLIAALNR